MTQRKRLMTGAVESGFITPGAVEFCGFMEQPLCTGKVPAAQATTILSAIFSCKFAKEREVRTMISHDIVSANTSL
jgi:hypothetical protein